jgi:two-component sensor histidine kinase
VRQEIEPYRLDRGDRVVVNGPAVSLEPKLALSLGMIIHELGTNAAKYGSLSVPNGSLDVSWAVEKRSETHLVIDWTERDGPPAKSPEHRGFGLTLIEREVSHGLGGKVRFEFDARGLRANLRVPLASN